MCGGFCGVPRFPTTSALLVEQLVAVSKDGTKIPREHCQMEVAYETLRHFVQRRERPISAARAQNDQAEGTI